MKLRSQTALLLLALAMAFGWAGTAAAQSVTSSAIAGTVTGPGGQPLANANVVVTNTQTGALSRVVTRSNGRFLIQGLQPGGPYRINVALLGYAPATRTGIALALGETEDVSVQLAQQAVAIEGITVEAGAANEVISRSRTGAATVVGDSALRRTPTLTRDFTDLTRLVPQVNVSQSGTSGAGRNNRFNNIQIDGAANNDLFGLAASGTPGGQAGTKPITLEAIQEFQVVLAPFDVRQGGFTGVGINAITRSGTNDFKGSLAYYTRNEGLTGRYRLQSGELSNELEEFSQNDLAGSFGGPIVRDKAFFFVAVEPNRRESPVTTIVGETTGSNDVSLQQVTDVANFIQTNFGYDPGAIGGIGLRRESDNVFARLDVNLSDNNRLTLRHNYVDAFDDNLSRSGRSYTLGNGGYVFNSQTNSTVLQLNSTLPRGMYNELRINRTSVREEREVGDPFPRLSVRFANGASVNAGSENFSGANALDQDVIEIVDDLTFSTGAHNFTVGTSNEFASFSNLFVRNPFGNYQFNSFADLQAGRASRYEFSYLLPGGNERAEFDVRRNALYVQDRWDVMDNLQLTLGLRGDFTFLPTGAPQNDSVLKYYDRSTSDLPSSNFQFNPRFGFNWDVSNDETTQVRGGLGLFSGRAPYVWISNAYGNTGLDYVRFTCSGSRTPAFSADPFDQPQACAGTFSLTPNEINLLDPNLELPQIMRASLAVDRRLPFGLIGTVEGLYTKTVSDLKYQNLGIAPVAGQTVEGRPLYDSRFDFGTGGMGDVIDITNTDEGYNYSLTGQIQRPFSNSWEFSASYTYTQAKDVAPLTSSQAISNWRFQPVRFDPNNPELAHADFEVPHRFLVTVSKQYEFFRRAATDVSVVYVGQSGRPYSFRYGDDVNGDGSFGNDLVYVPASMNEIRFEEDDITPEQSWANLDAFISSIECLDEARGEIIERNTCREPWSSRFDVRIAQTIPTIRDHGLQFTMDIFNFGNLLNNRWGRDRFVPNNTFNLLFVADDEPDAQGRLEYEAFSLESEEDVFSSASLGSRYQIQLGLRYTF